MLAFQHTATVLKELPRSTGIHARNQGTDTHFSLQEDLALLKAHWHNFTTGTAKENANPINDRERADREKMLHRESDRKRYLRAGMQASPIMHE